MVLNKVKYLLDTNVIIYLLKNQHHNIMKVMSTKSPREICISSITLAELEVGINKSNKPKNNRLVIDELLQTIAVLPFDEKASYEYGKIRAYLEKSGLVMGGLDMLIAAHAKSINSTLVTHDAAFSRVKGLKVEDWT